VDGEKEMNDDYFGVCPICRKHDGYINVGRGHWFLCHEHKIKWFAGSNLFDSWKEQTEEEQRKRYDALGVGNYTEVSPRYVDAMSHYSGKCFRFEKELAELVKRAGIGGIDRVCILLDRAARHIDAWEPMESDPASVRRMVSIIRGAEKEFTREYFGDQAQYLEEPSASTLEPLPF
jgi:hypothetical protein